MEADIVGYKKEYRLKLLVPGRKSVNVTMPYEVIQREADKRQLSVKDFIAHFVAVAEYDNFDGIRYTFKEVGGGESGKTI